MNQQFEASRSCEVSSFLNCMYFYTAFSNFEQPLRQETTEITHNNVGRMIIQGLPESNV